MTGGFEGPYPAGFIKNDAGLAGNTQSGHNVVFGVLDGQEVVVKPFSAKEKRPGANLNEALHEQRMYKIVAGLGYETLRPLKVEEGDGIAFLITEKRPRLTPTSAIDIARSGSQEQAVVGDIATTLASLQGDMVTHGDAKLRNFSIDRLHPDDIVVVDLEGAQQHVLKGNGAEYFANSRRNDLRSIGYNLGRSGYGVADRELGSNKESGIELFGDTFMVPFLSVPAPRIEKSSIEAAFTAYQNGLATREGLSAKYSTLI